MERTKALFLDQREFFRNGLLSLFKDDPEIEIIAPMDQIAKWPDLIKQYNPDAIIVDVGYSGTSLVKEIKKRFSQAVIISITNDPTEEQFMDIFRGGVKTYLNTEDLTADSLKAAIGFSIKGSVVLSRHFSENLYKYLIPKDVHSYDPMTMSDEEKEESRKISNQEKAVIALILSGSSNREISKYLHISENTAKVHLRNLKNKLGVHPKQKLDSFFKSHRHVRSRMLLEYEIKHQV